MGVDAGSVYSEVRIKLDLLKADVAECSKQFEKLGTEIKSSADQYSSQSGKKYQESLKGIAKETETVTQKQKNLAVETGKTTSAFDKLKGIAGTLGIGVSIAAVIAYMKGAVVAAAEAENAVTLLDRALELRNMKSAKVGFIELANEMQRLGVAGDDEVIKLEAQLVAQGRSEAQIKQLIKAAAGLASVTGETLDSSLDQLNKTLDGTPGRMGVLRTITDGLTEAQLRNGEAVQRAVDDYSEFTGNGGQLTRELKKMKESFGDLSEVIGGEAGNGIKAASPIILEMVDSLKLLIPNLVKTDRNLLDMKGGFSTLGVTLGPAAAATKGLGSAFQFIASILRGDLSGALNRFQRSALDVFEGLINPVNNFVNFVIGGLNKGIEGINKLRAIVKQAPLDLIGEFKFFGLSDEIDKLQAKLDVSYEIIKSGGAELVATSARYNDAIKAIEAAELKGSKTAAQVNADKIKATEKYIKELDLIKDKTWQQEKAYAAATETLAALNSERGKQEKTKTYDDAEKAAKAAKEAEDALKKSINDTEKAGETTEGYRIKLAELNGQISDAIELERAKAIETIRSSDATAESMDEAEAAINAYFDALKKSKSVDDFKKKAAELRKTALSIAGSVKDIFVAVINAIDESMQRSSDELLAKIEDTYGKMTEAAEKAYDDQNQASKKHYDEESSFLEDWYDLKEELIQNDGKTNAEVLQAGLDAAIAAGDTEKAAELQKQIDLINLKIEFDTQKKALDDKNAAEAEARDIAFETAKAARELEYQRQKAKIEYEAALDSWKISVATSIANAAIVTLNGFMTEPFIPAGIIAGAAAAIIGGVQVAAVASARPTKPTLATGGIVLPRAGGVPTVQAENGYPELSLNGGPSGRALLREFAREIVGEMGAAGGGGTIILQPQDIILDGKKVAESTASYVRNGQVVMR